MLLFILILEIIIGVIIAITQVAITGWIFSQLCYLVAAAGAWVLWLGGCFKSEGKARQKKLFLKNSRFVVPLLWGQFALALLFVVQKCPVAAIIMMVATGLWASYRKHVIDTVKILDKEES